MNDMDDEVNLVRPKSWGPGRRCNECGNPTWECACIEDNLAEE
jgi:hypothetical protein